MAIHTFRFVTAVCLVVFSLGVFGQTSELPVDEADTTAAVDQPEPEVVEPEKAEPKAIEPEVVEPKVLESKGAEPVVVKTKKVVPLIVPAEALEVGDDPDLQLSEPIQPAASASESASPKATNIDLKEVIAPTPENSIFPDELVNDLDAQNAEGDQSAEVAAALLSTENVVQKPNIARLILGVEVPPATTTRLDWTPSKSFAGMAVDTPVLVANGAYDGPTLCLTAAIHGDELNGIEMVRRVLYDIDPKKLHGMILGVPIVNLLGFTRNSRYLPDRRDLNRYFPGNDRGSVASRLAHAFFTDVIKHCNALVDLHTGSFYRTNITQLRADMSKPAVAEFAELFGDIPVLNTGGNGSSLRAAAVRAGIPAVTLEAGEPMRMQVEVVEEGVKAINTLLEKNGMYPSFSLWAKPSPAFYRSAWVRANSSGILFSAVKLGGKVKKGDVLGQVINPISNEKRDIISVHQGRILGMALDQFVLPGFAAYHIGILQPRLKKKAVMPAAVPSIDDDDEDGMLDSEQKPAVLETPKPMTPEEEGFDDE